MNGPVYSTDAGGLKHDNGQGGHSRIANLLTFNEALTPKDKHISAFLSETTHNQTQNT